MLISFIIIAKERNDIVMSTHTINSIMQIQKNDFEIITSIGTNPALQRNEASKISNGEWLFFLDNDSEIDVETILGFQTALIKFPNAKIFGGPSLIKKSENSLQKAIQYVFSTDFGIGPLKARYYPFGNIRESSEKELILCNLIVHRKLFMELNGFNINFHPNEENEFLNRLSKTKSQIIYSPTQVVFRKHRETVLNFFQQVFNYGLGRTKQFIYSKNVYDLIYYVPCIFFLVNFYLLTTGVKSFSFIMLGFYFLMTAFSSLMFYIQNKKILDSLLLMILFPTCHFGYSLGLIVGLVYRKVKNKNAPIVNIELSSTQDV